MKLIRITMKIFSPIIVLSDANQDTNDRITKIFYGLKIRIPRLGYIHKGQRDITICNIH